MSALLHSATLVLCSMVLLHKVGFHSATPTVATMCGLSHCWVTMMMLGNAGDLKHVLAYSTSSHAAVLTLLSLQGDWQSLEICVWVASGGSSS